MTQYNIIAESKDYTVLSEYSLSEKKSDAYQSEAELEQELIHNLCE